MHERTGTCQACELWCHQPTFPKVVVGGSAQAAAISQNLLRCAMAEVDILYG